MKKIKKNHIRVSPVVVGFVVFGLVLGLIGNSTLYRTSVVSMPEHKAFDGTVYPVSVIPDYVHLKADRYKLPFDSYTSSELVAIPTYDAAQLKMSYNDLKWGNPEHDAIRNAKLAYSTPYMGNYKLDGVENAGSHLAVDIKIPVGTPIYSIANGVVIKVSQQDSGFGKHIVVQHNNVPSYDNPSVKTTYFSSYSHLSQTNVAVNDVVVKGQMIAKSGDTGTVTTPHIHFQIDNLNAPWHPYWPFTWKEASDAGLDFFSAINAGLGKEKAISTTINPLMYVQKHLGTTNSIPVATATVTTPAKVEESLVKVEETPAESYVNLENTTIVSTPEVSTPEVFEPKEEELIPEVVPLDPPVLTFKFETEPVYYYENKDLKFSLTMADQYGNSFKEGFSGDLLISSVNDKIRISAPLLNMTSFSNDNKLTKKFIVRGSGKDRLKIEYNGETFYSDWFEVNKVDMDSVFKDVSSKSSIYESIEYLNNKGVVNGYEDGTFRPNNPVTRVEALKLILKSTQTKTKVGALKFKDTENNSWYSEFLYTAVENGIVKGYEDGTFKPENSVSKAEFYKMLFKSAGINLDNENFDSSFVDISQNDWFFPYFEYAKQIGIIDSSVKYASANEAISRGESAYAIFKVVIR
ncbi:MAG: S-layer homology domain-containing protein [Candidatus Gracilibacteria bacterium]|jgi:murein DD-endopeptidase MepM/ murein hydrolase activator NlpD|nr:S-layer homology domain-containing protein [Candidatus Gracilibacteria bacterium]